MKSSTPASGMTGVELSASSADASCESVTKQSVAVSRSLENVHENTLSFVARFPPGARERVLGVSLAYGYASHRMIRSKKSLVAPLEEPWKKILDDIAHHQGLPGSQDPKALSAAVTLLSSLYNGLVDEIPVRQALAARLSFSFPRDVPKGAAALAEVVHLLPRDRTLRVLDLGAGLGAMTRGAARIWAAHGATGELHATLVDQDTQALKLASQIAIKAPSEQGVRLQIRTLVAPMEQVPSHEADLVFVGQVLSEMHRERPAADRVERHVEWLHTRLQENVAPGGVLVIVEPALRDRTRHLHRIRAGLIDRGGSIFAPCLHNLACPMMANEHDWCHEDLAIDLPDWLIPIARSAGLRYQGLTFSYLVLRRDRRTLRTLVPSAEWRAVDLPKKTKGKLEIKLCGESSTPSLLRAMRLDRERSESNEEWGKVQRGDLLQISPPPATSGRLSPDALVERVEEPTP